MKKVCSCALRGLVTLCVLLLIVLAGTKCYLDATYFDGYDPKAPMNVQVTERSETPLYNWTKFYFDGFRGERVPAVMAAPKDAKAPMPCVIFLHGIGDDKMFMRNNNLDQPFVRAGFAFVCFDQRMQGERELKAPAPLAELEALRVRAAHTVNDTRRLIDYLSARSDIAPDRIYLCGASYGAITGSTATAFDPRIRAAVLTYGGGNFPRILEAEEIQKELGRWKVPAQAMAWYLGSVFDPIRYVGRIAPRPVLLQNGKADTVIPPAAGQALQEAAGEPKKVLWYDGDHLGKTDVLDIPLATRVLNDALAFIEEQDAKVTAR